MDAASTFTPSVRDACEKVPEATTGNNVVRGCHDDVVPQGTARAGPCSALTCMPLA